LYFWRQMEYWARYVVATFQHFHSNHKMFLLHKNDSSINLLTTNWFANLYLKVLGWNPVFVVYKKCLQFPENLPYQLQLIFLFVKPFCELARHIFFVLHQVWKTYYSSSPFRSCAEHLKGKKYENIVYDFNRFGYISNNALLFSRFPKLYQYINCLYLRNPLHLIFLIFCTEPKSTS